MSRGYLDLRSTGKRTTVQALTHIFAKVLDGIPLFSPEKMHNKRQISAKTT